MWTRTEYYSGDIYEDEKTYSPKKGKKTARGDNAAGTNEAQLKINEKTSKRQLNRLVNANFKPGDLWATFTYAPPPPKMKTALRRIKVLLARLRKLYPELGLPDLKYIGVTTEGTEHDAHRIHHHFILPYMPDALDVLSELWRWGTVKVERIGDDAEHGWLAGYIFGNARGQRGKRWTQSRNLARPVVVERVGVRGPRLGAGAKERRGYVVVRHEEIPTRAGLRVYTMYKRVDGKPNKPRRRRC